MEDYAIRRKEYVQKIRASFEQNGNEYDVFDNEESEFSDYEVSPFLSFKIRLVVAIILLLAFLFCKYNDYPIFRQNSDEIIDMIGDNQYYTILKKYVKI